MEHTPIPWRVRESVTSTQIISADGAVTANAAWCPAMEANAAFIVQAVNAHQALVEALEAIVTHRGKCFIPEDRTAPHALYEWTERARAALKQARGEEVAS